MWRIRREQAVAVAGAVEDQLEDELAAHLRRAWPDESAALSDEALLGRVRDGVARARARGITTPYDLARFLDLLLLLGDGFDASPERSWA